MGNRSTVKGLYKGILVFKDNRMDGWMDDRKKIKWGRKILDDWGEKLAKRAPYIDKNEGFWLQGEHNFPAKSECT